METNAYNGFSIKIVRDFYGLNQSQFAKLLGISQPVISKLEKGDKNLEENQIEKFKEYFEPNFFKRNVENVNQKLFYRKLSSITKTKLGLFEARLNLLHNTISEALEILGSNKAKGSAGEIVVHKKAFFSLNKAIISSSNLAPCSIESTPFSKATRTPSDDSTCAATL